MTGLRSGAVIAALVWLALGSVGSDIYRSKLLL
jgi:hypothetical protein